MWMFLKLEALARQDPQEGTTNKYQQWLGGAGRYTARRRVASSWSLCLHEQISKRVHEIWIKRVQAQPG
jgi:hypothetical protein